MLSFIIDLWTPQNVALVILTPQSKNSSRAPVKQKLAYAGHVMRGSGGLNALLVLEEKFDGKKTRGRPRRTWTDDVIQRI